MKVLLDSSHGIKFGSRGFSNGTWALTSLTNARVVGPERIRIEGSVEKFPFVANGVVQPHIGTVMRFRRTKSNISWQVYQCNFFLSYSYVYNVYVFLLGTRPFFRRLFGNVGHVFGDYLLPYDQYVCIGLLAPLWLITSPYLGICATLLLIVTLDTQYTEWWLRFSCIKCKRHDILSRLLLTCKVVPTPPRLLSSTPKGPEVSNSDQNENQDNWIIEHPRVDSVWLWQRHVFITDVRLSKELDKMNENWLVHVYTWMPRLHDPSGNRNQQKLFELNLTCLLRYLRCSTANLIWEAGVPIVLTHGPDIRVTATGGLNWP